MKYEFDWKGSRLVVGAGRERKRERERVKIEERHSKSSDEDFLLRGSCEIQYFYPFSPIPLAVLHVALNNSTFSPISSTHIFRIHVIYR